MDDKQREKVLKGKDIEKIAEACNRYPSVTLEYQLGERDEEEMQITVKLIRDEPLANDFVISNCFPGEK